MSSSPSVGLLRPFPVEWIGRSTATRDLHTFAKRRPRNAVRVSRRGRASQGIWIVDMLCNLHSTLYTLQCHSPIRRSANRSRAMQIERIVLQIGICVGYLTANGSSEWRGIVDEQPSLARPAGEGLSLLLLLLLLLSTCWAANLAPVSFTDRCDNRP